MKFINKVQRFMMYRYGVDELYRFLLILYLIVIIIDLFVNSPLLTVIELLIVFIMFYRFFSKNITRRRKENQKFLEIKKKFRLRKRSKKENDYIYKKIKQRRKENKLFLKMKNKVKKPFEVIQKNREDKYHIYKRCPKCKTILRLPLPAKRGIKHAKCPHCKRKVTLFTLKYQKVEIIRNKK